MPGGNPGVSSAGSAAGIVAAAAARVAGPEALARAAAALRDMKMSINPHIATTAPVFQASAGWSEKRNEKENECEQLHADEH